MKKDCIEVNVGRMCWRVLLEGLRKAVEEDCDGRIVVGINLNLNKLWNEECDE